MKSIFNLKRWKKVFEAKHNRETLPFKVQTQTSDATLQKNSCYILFIKMFVIKTLFDQNVLLSFLKFYKRTL
jgi:hypothetical protein